MRSLLAGRPRVAHVTHDVNRADHSFAEDPACQFGQPGAGLGTNHSVDVWPDLLPEQSLDIAIDDIPTTSRVSGVPPAISRPKDAVEIVKLAITINRDADSGIGPLDEADQAVGDLGPVGEHCPVHVGARVREFVAQTVVKILDLRQRQGRLAAGELDQDVINTILAHRSPDRHDRFVKGCLIHPLPGMLNEAVGTSEVAVIVNVQPDVHSLSGGLIALGHEPIAVRLLPDEAALEESVHHAHRLGEWRSRIR